jgi:hypothetical protein
MAYGRSQQWYSRRVIAVFSRFFNGALGAHAQHLVVSAAHREIGCRGFSETRPGTAGVRRKCANAEMRKPDSLAVCRGWCRAFSETRKRDSRRRPGRPTWLGARRLSEMRKCGNSTLRHAHSRTLFAQPCFQRRARLSESRKIRKSTLGARRRAFSETRLSVPLRRQRERRGSRP